MKSKRTAYLLLTVAVMLAVVLVIGKMALEVNPRQLRGPLSMLPSELGPWQAVGTDVAMDDATRELLKPSDYLLRSYVDPKGRVTVIFVAFFRMQKEGQIIHSPRHCLPGSGWLITKRDQVEVPTAAGQTKVNHLVMGKDMETLSVLYWYQGRGRIEYSEYLDRAQLIWDGLFKNRTDGALIRMTTMVPDKARSREVLASQVALAQKLIPALKPILPGG